MEDNQQQSEEPGEDPGWRAQLQAEGHVGVNHTEQRAAAGRAEDRLVRQLSRRHQRRPGNRFLPHVKSGS